MTSRDKERRTDRRLPIKVPLLVLNLSEEDWKEEVMTEDVSAQGLLCHLSHIVSLGERLNLKARLHNGSAIELMGRVAHIVPVSKNQNRVGVEVVGDSKQWEQFFLSWAVDERD